MNCAQSLYSHITAVFAYTFAKFLVYILVPCARGRLRLIVLGVSAKKMYTRNTYIFTFVRTKVVLTHKTQHSMLPRRRHQSQSIPRISATTKKRTTDAKFCYLPCRSSLVNIYRRAYHAHYTQRQIVWCFESSIELINCGSN